MEGVLSITGDPAADSKDATDDENGRAFSISESEVGSDSAGDKVLELGPSFGFGAKGLLWDMVVVLRGTLGAGLLLASSAFFRSSAAFFSRASFSAGEGTFNLMFNLRTPAVKLSISSAFCCGFTTTSGVEDVGSVAVYENGTLGTGGAFFGLVDRFGVEVRDPLETLVFLTSTLSGGLGPDDVEGLELAVGGVGLPDSLRFSSGSERILDAALCLLLCLGLAGIEDASREGSGKSFTEAIVVLRLF